MTTTKTLTIAERIAAMFDNDGSNEHRGSKTISDICDEFKTGAEMSDNSEYCRYEFSDGSFLTVGHGWDYGYSDCFCWQGNGHDHTCEAGLGN